jgi:hypothetical protein
MEIGMKQYAGLAKHLRGAYDQASKGKGKERHASEGQPFEQQVIVMIGMMLDSFDYELGQAIKKTIEAKRLYQIKGPEYAIQELYGAINYLAGACRVIELQTSKKEEVC